MSRRLVYFDLNGYAECIRYMLHYGGLKFQDVRHDFKSFAAVKDSMPYGQVPIFEEDGRVLNQSMAIARYVAGRTDLLPADPWEQAKLDAAVLTVYDFIKKLADYFWEPEPVKKEVHKRVLDEAIPYFLSRFEKELQASGGHFGRKLFWADFVLVGAIELFNLYLSDSVHTDYPNITALLAEVQALPGVKDYISTREPYVKPGGDSSPNQSSE